MYARRPSLLLSRLVVGWFALAICILSALSLSSTKNFELVCSSSTGIKLVLTGDDGQVQASHHAVDCPMCLGAALPFPDAPAVIALHHAPLAYALKPAVAAHIAALVGAPLPPRGPPSFA